MNNSKLIHDYLDGNLKQPEQDMLFAELANNSEMRNEFNQQMKLHMIAQNDMALITPPAATANTIFAELGFRIPPGDTPSSGASAGFGSNITRIFKKLLPNMVTAIVAAALTAFILYWLLDFGNTDFANKAGANSSDAKPLVSSKGDNMQIVPVYPQQNGLSEADVQRIINNAMSNYMNKVDNYYRDYYAALLNLTKNNSQEQNRNANVTEQPNSNFKFWEYLVNNNQEQPRNNNSLTTDNNKMNRDAYLTLTPNTNPNSIISNFNLSFRGFSTRSNINIDVPSQSNPWFNNMSAGASYNLHPNHALGVAIGQEAFAQVFNRKLYGEDLKYFQNPLLFWYGATYRYSLKQLFVPNVFYPYIELMGGFTKVGPMGRAQVGLSYSPDKRVTLNLGLEGTGLWYNVQGKVYQTNKIGLTYGVNISY